MSDSESTKRTPHPLPWSRRTLAAQAMGQVDPLTRAVVPPVHLSTTFVRDPDNQYSSGFTYRRPDNQTVRETEEVLAMLEGAPEARIFSSGNSAAVAVFLALSPGDHIVAPQIMYWGLRSWLLQEAAEWGLLVTFVDMSDLDEVQAAVRPGVTRLVWIETPANPLWTITDIEAVAAIAHRAGAKLAIDSTCATPVLSRPLEFGADLVMHSCTKYLNGHSDVLAGGLVCAEKDELWSRIARVRATTGMVLGPWDAYLLLRGMRTLDLRVRAVCATALALAERLNGHPLLEQVLYPGLASHDGHALAARQMTGGFGGMLSIRVRGGEAAAVATAAQVHLWKRATSLGGPESLIEQRASVEGPSSLCPPDLLRLSVGLEDPDDLYRDLDEALTRAVG